MRDLSCPLRKPVWIFDPSTPDSQERSRFISSAALISREKKATDTPRFAA